MLVQLVTNMAIALQKPTREAVQQLIEQLRGRGKTALTILMLGTHKLQHPLLVVWTVLHAKAASP